MIRENLTEDNFLLLCAKHYKRSYLNNTEEFLSDIKRIKYIKKLVTRFKSTGSIDEQLVLNHIVILNNIFGPEFLCRILYLKLGNYFEYIKPFLLFLQLLPPHIHNVNNQIIHTSGIMMNEKIVTILKALKKNQN